LVRDLICIKPHCKRGFYFWIIAFYLSWLIICCLLRVSRAGSGEIGLPAVKIKNDIQTIMILVISHFPLLAGTNPPADSVKRQWV